MMKIASRAIKAANPKAKIVGFSGIGGGQEDWTRAVLDALGENPGQYFDIISMHDYIAYWGSTFPEQYLEDGSDDGHAGGIKRLIKLFEEYGVSDKILWCSEFGHTENYNKMDLDAELVGDYMIRQLMLHMQYYDVAHMYVLQRKPNPPSEYEAGFSDYYDNTYGAASTLTTLADTVAVAFWTDEIDTPQETNFALVDENGHVIPFRGSYSLADKTYIMNLNEYLTKDTEYTLTVSGLTVGGNPLPNYTQVINSAVQGEVIVEPMYIMQGSEKKSSGALANGDTVTAGTRVINTTGDIKTYSFFAALYDHGVLKMVDFAEVEQDGATSAEDKEANLSCSFTMSAEDAASITNIKAFLWDGFETLGPILPAIEFTNTAAAE